MIALTLLALGVVVLIASSQSERYSSPETGSDNPPMDAVKNAIEANAPMTPALASPSAEEQAWIDLYKKKFARVSGVRMMPPEFPQDSTDLGSEGDLDKVPEVEREEIAYALFVQEDPHTLSMLADEIENDGYPIAANRLREKAVRIVAHVGSPETSPMPELVAPEAELHSTT